jgi:hypothetical protein
MGMLLVRNLAGRLRTTSPSSGRTAAWRVGRSCPPAPTNTGFAHLLAPHRAGTAGRREHTVYVEHLVRCPSITCSSFFSPVNRYTTAVSDPVSGSVFWAQISNRIRTRTLGRRPCRPFQTEGSRRLRFREAEALNPE